MKLLIFEVLIFCSLAFSSPLTKINDFSDQISVEDSQIAGNPIDDLWKQALEFIRALLKKYEPFEVPDMPVQTVTGDGISLTAKFDKVMVSKADSFVIDKIENNIFGLWAKFQVTLPTMHVEGDYTVTGNVKGKSVNGKGHFNLDLVNLVTGGYIKVGFKENYLQMTQLDLYYTIENLSFNETGLEVEGMTHQQLEHLFQHSFLQYFQENENFVCSQVSAYVVEQANKIMYGKSLKDLLQWLKDFIDGKIIPHRN